MRHVLLALLRSAVDAAAARAETCRLVQRVGGVAEAPGWNPLTIHGGR